MLSTAAMAPTAVAMTRAKAGYWEGDVAGVDEVLVLQERSQRDLHQASSSVFATGFGRGAVD